MNQKQKARQKKAKKLAASERKLRKQEAILEEQEEFEEDEIDLEPVAKDSEPVEDDGDGIGTTEKYMDVVGDSPYPIQPAPTSWEDMDGEENAREKIRALDEVSWNTRELVMNIIRSPELEVEAKGDAIKAVGDGFVQRSKEILDEPMEEEEKSIDADMDLLELEALRAYDRRHASIADMIKAVVSYQSRENMPDSNFALVTTRDGKKIRKYLIHDKAHVRNALARAAQQIKAGGQGASDARAALPKIRAAAKKFGIDVSSRKERSAIAIEKDASGNWRWIGWVSNNFLDWDGEIISEDAHKEYVDWLDNNMEVAPAFLTWHTPGTMRKNRVDFATYENGFLIMSGKLEENEAAALLRAQKVADLGMSHGSFVLARDPEDPRTITKYRMYEASDLPIENAANPFTNFETVTKEVSIMDKTKYLSQILGSEEEAKKFIERAGLKQKELQDAEIPSKEKSDVPAPDTTEQPPAEPAQEVPPADQLQGLIDRIGKEFDIEGLNAFVTQAKEAMEKVPVLEALIKDMQAGEDQKIADKIAPAAAKFAWSVEKRASQADETAIPDSDPLTKNAPGVPEGYWLSEATGTQPVKQ